MSCVGPHRKKGLMNPGDKGLLQNKSLDEGSPLRTAPVGWLV